jgi:hypothetical protein
MVKVKTFRKDLPIINILEQRRCIKSPLCGIDGVQENKLLYSTNPALKHFL